MLDIKLCLLRVVLDIKLCLLRVVLDIKFCLLRVVLDRLQETAKRRCKNAIDTPREPRLKTNTNIKVIILFMSVGVAGRRSLVAI